MGMAASQARFLTLTARKSNTEYQGQQVNQQRTSLANESANIYNKLANMDVPTAPSKTSFNRDIYTFKGGDDQKFSIMSVSNVKKEGNKTTATLRINYNVPTDTADKINLGEINSYTAPIGSTPGTLEINNTKKYAVFECGKGEGQKRVNDVVLNKYCTDNGVDSVNASDFVFAQEILDDEENKLSTTGRFIHKSQLVTDENGNYPSDATYYAVGTRQTPTTKEIEAEIERNDSNRCTKVKITEEHGLGVKGDMELGYEYGTDEDEYEKAFADYEYKKAIYDKEVDVLNSKTEVIQNQDKRLELKLKQLDTERNALNTEMEAVKGYLKKNVEGTFNTFG
ncbi:hypothetical protein IKA15_03475 [bacterium]|nr:hypothetical protein [bacterium]